jgi:hypothetical protein
MLHSFSRRATAVLATTALATGVNFIAVASRADAYVADCRGPSVPQSHTKSTAPPGVAWNAIGTGWYTNVPGQYTLHIKGTHIDESLGYKKTTQTMQTLDPYLVEYGLAADTYHVWSTSPLPCHNFDTYVTLSAK